MARRATPAARRPHEPQPIRNQPVGLGFLYRAGPYRSPNHRFRPRVGDVDIWNDFRSGDGIYPPRVRRDFDIDCWIKGKLSLRADSMSPNQSAISQWSWGFHTVRGGIDQRNYCFRFRVVGVVEYWKDF